MRVCFFLFFFVFFFFGGGGGGYLRVCFFCVCGGGGLKCFNGPSWRPRVSEDHLSLHFSLQFECD